MTNKLRIAELAEGEELTNSNAKILEEIDVKDRDFNKLVLLKGDTSYEHISEWLIRHKEDKDLLDLLKVTPTIKDKIKKSKNFMSGTVIFEARDAMDELELLRQRSMKDLVFVIYRATPNGHRPMLEYGNIYEGRYYNMSSKIMEDLEEYLGRVETNNANGIVTVMPNSKYTLEEFKDVLNSWVN